MKHNILLTGASGYIGGSILARWRDQMKIATVGTLYALVRSDAHAEAVQSFGAEPIKFDASDSSAVRGTLMEKQISIVIHNIQAFDSTTAVNFIQGLAEVKAKLGLDVHFLHSSGAKLFSGLAGAPQTGDWSDNSPDIYKIQKSQEAVLPLMQKAINTNNTVVDESSSLGVYSYLVIPCIVYGKGEGFGNSVSIQTKAIVQAALAVKQMRRITPNGPRWPVSHISDTANLYLSILNAITTGKEIDHNQQGYYLAASGSIAWEDLYKSLAISLAKRGRINDDTILDATSIEIEEMAKALKVPVELVELQIGGNCTLTASRAAKIGWKSIYPSDHILEAADDEVDLVLAKL